MCLFCPSLSLCVCERVQSMLLRKGGRRRGAWTTMAMVFLLFLFFLMSSSSSSPVLLSSANSRSPKFAGSEYFFLWDLLLGRFLQSWDLLFWDISATFSGCPSPHYWLLSSRSPKWGPMCVSLSPALCVSLSSSLSRALSRSPSALLRPDFLPLLSEQCKGFCITVDWIQAGERKQRGFKIQA